MALEKPSARPKRNHVRNCKEHLLKELVHINTQLANNFCKVLENLFQKNTYFILSFKVNILFLKLATFLLILLLIHPTEN